MADGAPLAFDMQMRAEIRRRLKSYQARHSNLGAPTLHSRIRRANPKGFDFSLKTLQRLLGDSHDTFDSVYNECLLFLTGAEQPDPMAGLSDLAATLFGFVDDVPSSQPDPPPAELEGTYQVRVAGAVFGDEDLPDYDPRLPYFPISYSRMVFTAVPERPWFRAIEYVGNPKRRRDLDAEGLMGRVAEICTGTMIALMPASTYLVVLRGFTFNHPKFYLLAENNLYRTDPPTLDGNCIDREPTGQAESVFAHLRVLLRRVKADELAQSIGVSDSVTKT